MYIMPSTIRPAFNGLHFIITLNNDLLSASEDQKLANIEALLCTCWLAVAAWPIDRGFYLGFKSNLRLA